VAGLPKRKSVLQPASSADVRYAEHGDVADPRAPELVLGSASAAHQALENRPSLSRLTGDADRGHAVELELREFRRSGRGDLSLRPRVRLQQRHEHGENSKARHFHDCSPSIHSTGVVLFGCRANGLPLSRRVSQRSAPAA
jgi:hypothetical protein